MRIGLFCFYANPTADSHAAIANQTALARQAETVGFDDIWVAEHHFDPHAISPSILVLLGHLAGITTRVRLGSAAVLLPFHDPIQVAEDIATIDVLSGGRFEFGVAKGGPFPQQNRLFKVGKEQSRQRMLEALTLIHRLLEEETVTYRGDYYQAENVTLTPRPVQQPIPTWIATSTEDGIHFAAERHFGLMGGLPAPMDKLRGAVDCYRAKAKADPKFTLSRLYFGAPTREEALEAALPYIRDFADRMRANALSVNPGEKTSFFEDLLLERALLGSFAEIRDKIAGLREALPIHTLILKPACNDPGKAAQSLTDFADHIRPYLAP